MTEKGAEEQVLAMERLHLSDGKYRIIKKIYETIEDEIHTHYLAVEFEIR